jgi:two-component system, chemotaxis family, sensor kinase CheA
MQYETWSDPLTNIESASFFVPTDTDPALLSKFVERAMERLQSSDWNLSALDSNPADKESLESVFGVFYSIHRVAELMRLEGIRIFCGEVGYLLDQIRNGSLLLQYPVMDCLFDSVAFIRKALADLKRGIGEAEDQQVQGQSARLRIRMCLLLSGEFPDFESQIPAPKKAG